MIIFRSGAGAGVPVYPEVADLLIAAMGRPVHEPGEVSVEQVPAVLAQLRLAFEDSTTHAPLTGHPQSGATGSRAGCDRRSEISLAERAVPLIELFERAQRTRDPVRWG